MVSHPIKDLGPNIRDRLQQFIADHRMTVHDLLFALVKTSGLVEYSQWNTGLAYVVKRRRQSKPHQVRIREFDIQREFDCYSRHQQAVLEGPFMIATHII